MNPSDVSPSLQAANNSPASARIAVVLVTYNPDSSLEQNIRALLRQVDKLIVVDNGSEPAIRNAIETLASKWNFEVIWNGKNLGLAKALNIGVGRLLSVGDYAWIATFDQDSLVDSGFRDAVLGALAQCPFRDKVAAIGPQLLMRSDSAGANLDARNATASFAERKVVLQSGCMISAAVLRDVCMFDETFFIDYVDFEFCLHVRKRGFRILEATNTLVTHRVGAPSLHRFLNITCMVFNHSPVRRYYAARNRLRVYWRYFLSDPHWICHDAWSWFKEVIKLLLFEQDRRQKLAYITRGLWDAVLGRSGAYTKGIANQD